MSYFLGIDGGGTRTTAWLSDQAGRILARAVAGPSNPLKVGLAAAEREIVRAAREAIRQANAVATVPPGRDRRRKTAAGTARPDASGPPLQAVCVGLAGADRPAVTRRLLPRLRRALPAGHHLLTSDAAIALRAAVGLSPGIIVISGTGSIAFGRDEHGRVLRAGGWGSLFDDVGSGFDLGRKAIAAALRDHDGRGPFTQLTVRICETLKLQDITEIVLHPPEPHRIASLFPLVLEAARRRDFVAQQLCEQAGRDLAELAVALLKRTGWLRRVAPVVCAGGVLRSSARIRRSFKAHLRRQAPAARVLLLRHSPVEGALAMAREVAGKPV